MAGRSWPIAPGANAAPEANGDCPNAAGQSNNLGGVRPPMLKSAYRRLCSNTRFGVSLGIARAQARTALSRRRFRQTRHGQLADFLPHCPTHLS